MEDCHLLSSLIWIDVLREALEQSRGEHRPELGDPHSVEACQFPSLFLALAAGGLLWSGMQQVVLVLVGLVPYHSHLWVAGLVPVLGLQAAEQVGVILGFRSLSRDSQEIVDLLEDWSLNHSWEYSAILATEVLVSKFQPVALAPLRSRTCPTPRPLLYLRFPCRTQQHR